MRKIEQLRKQAIDAASFRGHSLGQFCRKYRHWWSAQCKICGKGVYLNDDPCPNEISIHGEAVALHCTN